MNASDSRAHFQDAHFIEEPRSNCVSRKRKSEDDEENVQDTNMSKKAKNEDEKIEGKNAGPMRVIEHEGRGFRACEQEGKD
ncbi:hypothetical protein V495_00299 [Pseudogymnoascus sp. VKM F-4514 (FW-929)]|nr:hypothetical protein V495_00299 [Pseudogymnoascus sp. VKM F-4514 (FW-929)]